MGLWVRAGSWSAQQLTEGKVPDYIVRMLGSAREATTLVDVGLWERNGEGYVFRNWDKYQPSREKVEADRAANRERMRKWRERRD